MEILDKALNSGVFLLQNKIFTDSRGSFVKNFQQSLFIENNLAYNFQESYFSTSVKNVLRGMHFQSGESAHEKLVFVNKGEILDVSVDVRPESTTFGQYFSTILNHENGRSIYLQKGLAHGFLTLSEEAIVTYLVTTEYDSKNDTGILWNSFGLDWGIADPIISERDQKFQKLIK